VAERCGWSCKAVTIQQLTDPAAFELAAIITRSEQCPALAATGLVGILSRELAHRLGESTGKSAFVGATAIVIAVSTTSGAQADTCAPNAVFVTPGIFRAPPPPIPLLISP
jgi:hypothetical protein